VPKDRPSIGSVNITDVAIAANVSVGTVSNVLNQPERVAPRTRQRVEAVIADLGYVRNESARHLRAGRSRTIGLIVLDVRNPFFTDLARGVEDAAAAAGSSVMLCNSDDNESKERHHLSVLAEHRVMGILVVPVGPPRHLDALRARGIPVVRVDSTAAANKECSVSVDDIAGGRTAVAHLIETGHTRIAFIGGKGRERQVADRLKGARDALRKAGTRTDALVVLSAPSLQVAGGREAGRQLLELPARQRPTAVFCANDLLALGVLQELTRVGAQVPEDIAIIGYDDIDFASAAAVPLSSVSQPRQLLGQRATELLLEEAGGQEHRHQRVVFQPELVVRDSTVRPVGAWRKS
jgi:LacI family transcriptional regulator